MTKDQFVQCAVWWWEGRLLENGSPALRMPGTSVEFAGYSRREDPPKTPMPDEVWVADYGTGFNYGSPQAYQTREGCLRANHNAAPVRYVRAD